jgi:hypothetical protein
LRRQCIFACCNRTAHSWHTPHYWNVFVWNLDFSSELEWHNWRGSHFPVGWIFLNGSGGLQAYRCSMF